MRKEQKKIEKYFHDAYFNNKLKCQDQWEKFNEELDTTFSMIIGVQGVSLNYVIREDKTPNFDATVLYEEAIIQSVALTGS